MSLTEARSTGIACAIARSNVSTYSLWSPTTSSAPQFTRSIPETRFDFASTTPMSLFSASDSVVLNASSTSIMSTFSLKLSSNDLTIESPSGPTVSLQYSAVLTMRHMHLISAARCASGRRASVAFNAATSMRSFKAFAYAVRTCTNTWCTAKSVLPRVKLEHRLNTFFMFKNTLVALAKIRGFVSSPCQVSFRILSLICSNN